MIEVIVPFIGFAFAILIVSTGVCVTTYAKPGSHLRDELTVLRYTTVSLAIAIVLLVATVAFSATPNPSHLTDQVDLIDLNHYYDSQGRHVFDQVIFYQWSRADARFQVREWRLMKAPMKPPCRVRADGPWVMRWRDQGEFREVSGKNFRETWTNYDPEIRERDYLPAGERRGFVAAGNRDN